MEEKDLFAKYQKLLFTSLNSHQNHNQIQMLNHRVTTVIRQPASGGPDLNPDLGHGELAISHELPIIFHPLSNTVTRLLVFSLVAARSDLLE